MGEDTYGEVKFRSEKIQSFLCTPFDLPKSSQVFATTTKGSYPRRGGFSATFFCYSRNLGYIVVHGGLLEASLFRNKERILFLVHPSKQFV